MINVKKCLGVVSVFFVFLFNASMLQAGDLHVIMVGDLAAADLKSSIETDLEKMESQILNIAYYTGLDLQYTSFVQEKNLAQNVLKHICALETHEEDVVLFYYSGHGYRTPRKKLPWPNLYFTVEEVGLELDVVIQQLKSKQAHFVLVIADCCNSMMMDFLAPPLVKGLAYQDEAMIMESYKKLFLGASGCVVVASSKAGQSSYSIDNYGGLYTNALLKAFDQIVGYVSTEDLNWDLILGQSVEIIARQTQAWGVSQNPIFQVETGFVQ